MVISTLVLLALGNPSRDCAVTWTPWEPLVQKLERFTGNNPTTIGRGLGTTGTGGVNTTPPMFVVTVQTDNSESGLDWPQTEVSNDWNSTTVSYTTHYEGSSVYFCVPTTVNISNGSGTTTSSDANFSFHDPVTNEDCTVHGFPVTDSSHLYITGTPPNSPTTIPTFRVVKKHYSFTPSNGSFSDYYDYYYDRNNLQVTMATTPAASIDSRKTYGQPDKDGAYPAIDANADLRWINFYNWTFKGGLFIGNTAGTNDLSGFARIQAYPPSATQTNLRATAVSIYLLGMPTTTLLQYDFKIIGLTWSGSAGSISTATWGNKWEVAIPTDMDDSRWKDLASYPTAEWANVQVGNFYGPVAIARPENTTPGWRYFASSTYGNGSMQPVTLTAEMPSRASWASLGAPQGGVKVVKYAP